MENTNKQIDLLVDLLENSSISQDSSINEKNNDLFENIDILEILEKENDILVSKNTENNVDDILNFIDFSKQEETKDTLSFETKKTEKIKSNSKIKDIFLFFLNYVTTSLVIFILLVIGTNYSAYFEIAKSYLNADELNKTNQNMKNSIENTKIDKENEANEEAELNSAKTQEDKENKNFHSMTKILYKANNEKINLDIDITPYENRIIIPKIAKNIPLVNVENKQVTNVKELEDIFMEELKKGVVRYPGSGIPGEEGNMFVFGHSSNFPWVKGDYNDVFALLDKVVFNDEVIVYYGQKKYTYKIREKKVINPGEVSILKRNNGKSEITLMTCYPVGTSLHRLVVIGELVKE